MVSPFKIIIMKNLTIIVFLIFIVLSGFAYSFASLRPVDFSKALFQKPKHEAEGNQIEKKSSQVTNVGFTPETSVAVKKNLINARKCDHQIQQKPQAKENIHNPEYLRSKMGISADGRYTMTDELYNQLNEGQRRFVNSTNRIVRIK